MKLVISNNIPSGTNVIQKSTLFILRENVSALGAPLIFTSLLEDVSQDSYGCKAVLVTVVTEEALGLPVSGYGAVIIILTPLAAMNNTTMLGVDILFEFRLPSRLR